MLLMVSFLKCAAEEAGSITDALKEGKVTVDLRLRAELVDQDVSRVRI